MPVGLEASFLIAAFLMANLLTFVVFRTGISCRQEGQNQLSLCSRKCLSSLSLQSVQRCGVRELS